jgi:hypothetical protein
MSGKMKEEKVKKALLIVILTVVAFGILNAETKLKMELWNRWTYQTIDGEVTYLDFSNMLPIKDSKITVGLMKTYFGTIYDWTYITIDKDPSDKYKFVSSTDYGFGISGYLPNGFGTYALAAYNGEGYKKTGGDINTLLLTCV